MSNFVVDGSSPLKNQPDLNFSPYLKPNKSHQFTIIGLGRFGRAVCETLYQSGYDVLGIDVDEKRVANILTEGIVTHAAILDSTDPLALKEAGVFESDTAIVAIGNYLEESIITTLNLKEAGVSYVVAKASSDIHAKLLQKVGADRLVLPDREAGCNLAQTLIRPGILDRFDLDAKHSIVELKVPKSFHGKTISQLRLRSDYGLNILAIGESKNFDISPSPDRQICEGDIFVIVGTKSDIDRLPL